jgi:DNA-binding MarR family transcriptional regulator
LVVLEREGGWLRPASLAHRIGVTRQAAHTLMARLDDRGFLRWKVDGRIRSARLTDDGIAALASAREAVERIVDAIERTTIDERRVLVVAQRSVMRASQTAEEEVDLSRPASDHIKAFHTPSVAPPF